MTIGILLINLGTPEAPTEAAVKHYLDEFLCDPYIITLPTILRHFLVKKIILPRRSKKSAHAYASIWTPEGSPLSVNSVKLQYALQQALGENFQVALGMRYGKQTIAEAIQSLNACEKIMVLPLFPQFSRATTQSALDIVTQHTQDKHTFIIPDFYDKDFYIDALSSLIQSYFIQKDAFLLLSYHGLPQRHGDSQQYRAHCEKTSELIADKLQLSSEKYLTTFQSRLGLAKWIGPYTDQSLSVLREKGIRHLVVACPSFVADCIETLEEIDLQLQESWIKLGGESFVRVPCLNDHAVWVEGLAQVISVR